MLKCQMMRHYSNLYFIRENAEKKETSKKNEVIKKPRLSGLSVLPAAIVRSESQNSRRTEYAFAVNYKSMYFLFASVFSSK